MALLSRSEASLLPVQKEIESRGGRARSYPSDATSVDGVKQTFMRIRGELGEPAVLVYNAGAFVPGGLLELTAARFEAAWRTNCLGAFLALQESLPSMVAAKSGTVILTGATASLRGSAKFAGLAVGKFGLRALAQSAAREFGPQGVHVAHVIVDGLIDTGGEAGKGRPKDSIISPDAIADTFWHLHQQPPSAWTHELEVRPSVEKW